MDILWALWSLAALDHRPRQLAEERRLGVDSWQETLPVSRARRWWIKIGVAYGLAFGIGVIVPGDRRKLITVRSIRGECCCSTGWRG